MNLFEQIGKSIAAKVATVVVVILVLVGGYFGLKAAFPNFSFSFKRELKIAETANVVEQIKKISDFLEKKVFCFAADGLCGLNCLIVAAWLCKRIVYTFCTF